MVVERTIADVVAPNLSIMLMGSFDEVGEPYLVDGFTEKGIDGRPSFHVLTFTVDVRRRGRRSQIDADVRVGRDGMVIYPGIARCSRTGREFNIDADAIDRVLYGMTPRQRGEER